MGGPSTAVDRQSRDDFFNKTAPSAVTPASKTQR
jgi:hypothetical protein